MLWNPWKLLCVIRRFYIFIQALKYLPCVACGRAPKPRITQTLRKYVENKVFNGSYFRYLVGDIPILLFLYIFHILEIDLVLENKFYHSNVA